MKSKSSTNVLDNEKLKRSFYTRDLLTVSRELLGKLLIKKDSDGILAGRIVEVEAYDGDNDEAAHTFRGKTKRNAIMFGKGGFFYVYFTYGAHFCCNIVTGAEGRGTAVLIRGIEPQLGIQKMTANRFGRALKSEKEKFNLTNGPGKICSAFGIDKTQYGLDLTGDSVYLLNQMSLHEPEIVITRRVGITRSVDLPWRFYIKDNPYVSKK